MPPKRKRNEPASEAGGGRPAPHRPSDTSMGQHDRDGQDGTPNRRRSGAGGRNTRSRNADRRDSSNAQSINALNPPAPPRPTSSSSQAVAQAIGISSSTPSATAQGRAPVMTSNYNYAVLTEPRLTVWQQSGRQEVIQHGVASRQDEDVEEISTISQEFARAVFENRLDPTDAAVCIKEILGPQPSTELADGIIVGFDAHTLFVDTIAMFIDSLTDAESNALKPQLRDFILATQVSPQLLRQTLDASVLHQMGLIREHFTKFGIRHATNLLYRQSNYNLLREESEGFSKLITELYWTPHTLSQVQDQLTTAQVEAGFERVKGLIGTFDLDVGRVLDIVFDVFASTMMRTLRYYTMFLRVSSWWPRSQIDRYHPVFTGGLPRWGIPGSSVPTVEEQLEMDQQRQQRDIAFWERAREVHLDAFFELGGRRAKDAEVETLIHPTSGIGSENEFEINWIEATKTLPPPGNRVAAQLFGFKLCFYTSQARDKDEIIPVNLFFLAAYLIKIGFISLPDLYAHIWPADDKMDAIKERRMVELEEKEKKDRQGIEPNALLKAGALSDDTLPASSTRHRETASSKPEATKKDNDGATLEEEVLPEPREVLKVDLAQHLLLVGAIPEGLFLLGRFPWLLEAYPDEIISPINRILLHSIDKVYQETRPEQVHPLQAVILKPDLAPDQSGVPKGHIKLAEREAPKVFKWPHADGFQKGTGYEHYLKEWTDNVPVCQTVDDVFTLCDSLLNVVNVSIGREPTLLKKLAAIGAKSLSQDKSQHNLDRWRDLLKRIIFPALIFAGSNVDIVHTIWGLLKHYSTETRYNIYAECYEGQISRLPAMSKAFKFARLDTLSILKRLSLDNISNSAKQLAKVALFAPGIVCKVALDQIEAYPNLIEAFVECAKYFTELGHDVLVWSLLSSLGGKQRSRTQEDSILLTSKWLQALSKFSGKVFRRNSSMDPTPVIQYVNNQLSHGNSTDLIILRELITSMGGIVPDVDFTDAQLAALSGGEELRRQTLINLGDKRFDSTKSATRFMRALVHTRLAPKLLINLAQYRQTAIYNLPENETHIKYLATLIDDCQQTLVQYVELLRTNLSPEEFDSLVPSIPRLVTDFGFEPNLAFLIGRASLAYYLTGKGASPANSTNAPSSISKDALPIKADASMETNDGTSAADSMSVDEEGVKADQSDGSSLSMPAEQKSNHFLNVLGPIINTAREVLPSNIWDVISPEFYVLFWTLQSSDLSAPASSYNAESARLQKEHDSLRRDRSDMSREGTDRRNKRIAEIIPLMGRLVDELGKCQERVAKTKAYLSQSAPVWISAPLSQSDAIADMLLEECIIPRVLLAPGDAEFSHKMIKFLHDQQVRNFKVIPLYDRLFSVNRLRSLIFGCTIREAEFLGRFIKLTLGDLSRWHKSKDIYEREATKLGKHVGFATAVDADGGIITVIEHGQFRDMLWSWHRNLAAALKASLQGTEWMHIRNAITILKAVLDYFPAVDFHGRQFMHVLQKIAEREDDSKQNREDGQSHRGDLAVTANTAASALKKHESKWVIVQAFRPNITGDSSEDKKATESAKAITSSNLRPNAPEFNPQQAARSKAAIEDEDGEVKDGVQESADKAPKQSTAAQKPTSVPERADLARLSRPSTPTARAAAVSPGPNSRREASSKSSTLASLPPGLPSRPNVPFPSHFSQDMPGHISVAAESARNHRDSREPRDHRDHRDSRNSRDARDLRDPRQPDNSRSSRPRESYGNDRRPSETLALPSRELPRSEKDRLPPRSESGPPRWEPTPHDRETRSARDRAPAPTTSGRVPESVRAPRDVQTDANKGLPRPTPPNSQGPTINPERAALIHADQGSDQMSMNPARAALINDSKPTGRPPREDSRERSGRRNSPPRRSDRSEPSRSTESGRDGRTSRSFRSEQQRNERNPSPARGDRESNRPMPDRPRDASGFQSGPASSRGEAERAASNYQDPNYGRLNAIPSIADISSPPDAPRGRGRTLSRVPPAPSQPASRADARFTGSEPRRGISPDRQPPTGPASSRQRRGPLGHGNTPMSSPSTPQPASSGMHPDRMRHLNAAPGAASSPAQPSFPGPSANSVGIHPDRLSQIGSSQPPSGPSQHSRNMPPPMQTPERLAPMSGPSNSRQGSGGLSSTAGTENTSISAPTGPSAVNDRARSGGRRQLAGINNLLRESHMSGPDHIGPRGNTRGRPMRTNLAGSDAQILTGNSPVSTPVHERPNPIANDRGDYADSARSGANGDDRAGRSDRDRSRRHHDHGERSTRSSRHASRERSPTRDSRSKEHRDYRDKEPGIMAPTGNPREDPPRRAGGSRDAAPAPGGRVDVLGNSRIDNGRDRRHEDYARPGQMGRGGGNGSGGGAGGPPRGGDDHRLREPRGDDNGRGGGRKRRSEEGGYLGPTPDSHKRQRR